MPSKAIMVACPTCQAPIGILCKKNKPDAFTPDWWSHKARVQLAKQPGATDEGSRIAQEEMAAIVAGDGPHAFRCCDTPFADLGAIERHRSSGHTSPVVLGMTPTSFGWSSR